MQTGQLLANLLGISRQAVHAHLESANPDHTAWVMAALAQRVTRRVHFHEGLSPQARARLLMGQIQALREALTATQAAWGQFETNLRNGKRATRLRNVQEALGMLQVQLGLAGSDWLEKAVNTTFKALKETLVSWIQTDILPSPLKLRVFL